MSHPESRIKLRPEDIDRFKARVEIDLATDCHLWTGYLDAAGYGNFAISRAVVGAGHSRNVRAHRVAYLIATGVDPAEKLVCHSCDRPRCVNPEHLWLGTAGDNNADRQAKGRSVSGDRHPSRTQPHRRPRGEGHWNRRLDADKVRLIRDRRAAGASARAIADAVGVSKECVKDVLANRTWKHVR